MARRDRVAAADVRFEEDAHGGGLALDTESPLPPTGPHDSDDLDPEVTDAAGLVDFGSLRVPVPPEGTVTVEPTAGGRMQAVHIRLPEGRLSVSALAAPKSSKLWPELAREIDASLREGGARVRSFPGGWGRELHATSGGATSVFIGVDGSRWMLYGVATGPSAHAAPLDAELRRMLRGTVVVRGKQPYPVRTILPLTMPDHLAEEAAATPAVPAPGAKKRSQAKTAVGKSAPGKAAPGKTAPPNSDAAAAAAKKAAARRAAARKAAAAAAVKAAAEALAEQAAEDRATAGEQADTGSAAPLHRTGPHPVRGTIPSGPGPDAPLREQAPSARRAAAAAWRTRPAVPGSEGPPPTEALPVARPVEEPPVTEAFPATPRPTDALLPTEALRIVEPGTGGRRRLGEPAPPAPPPPGGRRHLQDPPVEESFPGGRRRLREPAADLPPPGPRRPHEPDGALGATAPWDMGEPGGRRRLREPAADPAEPTSGRRRLQEPGEAGPEPSGQPAEPFGADPATSGVSASGRRRLREPWDGADPLSPAVDTGVAASGRRRLQEPWEPGPAADTGASGRRRLQEPWDGPAGPDGSGGRRRLREPANGSAADTGVSASGRRRLREPWDDAGLDRGPQPWETQSRGPRLDEPPADTGVSATGRRRLREAWDERTPGLDATGEPALGGRRGPEPLGGSGPAADRRRPSEPWESAGPASDPGVSATGRRRLREPWDDAGSSGRRRLNEPDPFEPTGHRRRDDDDRISGTGGRRRLREPEPPPVRDGTQTEPWLFAPDDPPEDRGARRTLSAEYLIETGEQDAGWAAAFDEHTGRRGDGGRHSGAGDASSPTVRLQALLSELDPNRPRRRHRR